MLFVMSSHKFNGAFIVCLCCILLIKPVRGEGPLPDLNKILVPVETALVVKSKSSERLLVLTIHPDPIPFCSLGYMSIWDFENADAFYAFRNLNQLTGLFPSEGLKSTKHELLQLKLGDSVEVAGSKLRWLPNTLRSSWLEQVDVNGSEFAVWRLRNPAPTLGSFKSFKEISREHNEESLELGSVPLEGQ